MGKSCSVYLSGLATLLLFVGVAQAVGITSGHTLSGSIAEAGEIDTYEFTASAGQSVMIRVSKASGNLWPRVVLNAPDPAVLSDLYDPTSVTINYRALPQSGTHTIRVRDGFSGTYTGDYRITLIKNPGNLTSPSDPDGGAITEGVTASGSIALGDLDVFTFWGDVGDVVTVAMGALGGNVWPGLRLEAPDGSTEATAGGPSSTSIDDCLLTQTGTYYIICYDDFSGTYTGAYNVSLSIMAIKPEVFLSVPADGETTVSPYGDILLRFTKPMRTGTVEYYTSLGERSPAGAKDVPVAIGFTWAGAQAVHVVPSVPLGPERTYRLVVDHRVKSVDGRMLRLDEDFVMEFSTSNTLIASSSPADGATEVVRRMPVRVNFRWPVRPPTVEPRFKLRDSTGTALSGTITWPVPRRAMVFTPNDTLGATKTYTAGIEAGARLDTGRLIKWAEEFSFTTANAPVVVAWEPIGQSVAIGSPIGMTFDRAMQRAQVQNCFVIQPATAGAFRWALSGKKLIFDPTASLVSGQTYEVQIKGGARSLNGTAMGQTFTWQFRTEPTFASPPTVTATAVPTGRGAQVTVNLMSSANVEVRVCNLAGREVAVLSARPMAAGLSTLLWNGRTLEGTAAPTGAYLVRVRAVLESGAQVQALCGLRVR